MAIELTTDAPARIVRGENGKSLGFTDADIVSAREWRKETTGKSSRGVLADLTLLEWYAAGQPFYAAPAKSASASTNGEEVVATVTVANRKSDGTPGAKRSSVDVTRADMRAVRTDENGKQLRGRPGVLDYVNASGRDDDAGVVIAVDTTGGQSFTYDYESDSWTSTTARTKQLDAANATIAALMARLEALESGDTDDDE